MAKRFSIGSKKENAKNISINLKPIHIYFGLAVLVLSVLYHTFIYSPYLTYEYKMSCFDDSEVIIKDNMTKVCEFDVPSNMKAEDIYAYIQEQQKIQFIDNARFLQ